MATGCMSPPPTIIYIFCLLNKYVSAVTKTSSRVMTIKADCGIICE